jgi:SSS family solute:Na+ symporter/sodium/proline symporter
MLLLSAVLAYLGLLVGVAWLRRAQAGHGESFLVAGRSLSGVVLLCSLSSAWIGAGSLFAGAGLAYRAGFPALWQAAGAWVGIALVFAFAARVRRVAQYTVPDILELRYGPAARALGSLAIVIAYTAIAAFQFRGGGRILTLIAGVEPRLGAFIVAAVCIACTALGGMRSVASLDVVNGLAILAGFGVAAALLVGQAGGPGPALDALRPDQASVLGTLAPPAALALFFPTLVLLLGEASMYQKLFAARGERAARWAVAGWLAGTIVIETLIVAIGAFGSVALPGLGRDQSEEIVLRVAVTALPAVGGLLLVCGAAAIIVSTANSFLLTPATSLTRDIYQRFVDPTAPEARLVQLTRAAVVVLGLAGFVALGFFGTVLEMALWAYTVYGAGVTPALLAAFAWPRASRIGGVSSMGAGIAATLAWEIAGRTRGAGGAPLYPFGLETIYVALFVSTATLVIVSLQTRPPREEDLEALR